MQNPFNEPARALEERRRQAMLAGDADALDPLLADPLVYTHSIGFRDTKAQFMARMRKGVVRYARLEFDIEQVLGGAGGCVVSGITRGTLRVPQGTVELHVFYTAVWLPQPDGRMAMAAWNGTAVPATDTRPPG